MQTHRFLILGASGSGKSTLVREELLPELMEKVPHLVVVNDNPEMSELCRARVTITDENASDAWAWARMIREQRTVHVELLANDPAPVLDALSRAILEVGDVVVVVDEAHEFVGAHNAPAGMVRLYKQGRKHGVHVVTITQSIVSTPTSGLSRDAVRQSTVLVVFQQLEHREVDRVRDEFPELGERVRELGTPETGAPEYAVLDRRRRSSLIYRRDGAEWLSDRSGAGAA